MCFRLSLNCISLTISLSHYSSLTYAAHHNTQFTARVYHGKKKVERKAGDQTFFVRTWRWRQKAANPSCWPSGKGRHIYSKLNHSPHKCTTSSGRDISALWCKYSKALCKLELRHWIRQLTLSVQRCSGETGRVAWSI